MQERVRERSGGREWEADFCCLAPEGDIDETFAEKEKTCGSRDAMRAASVMALNVERSSMHKEAV